MWLPKSRLPENVAQVVKEVTFRDAYLAEFDGNGSDVYIGGQTDLSPQALQRRVMQAALRLRSSYNGIAIVVAKAAQGSLRTICDDDSDVVFLDYVVGIHHAIGSEYSHEHDGKFLSRMCLIMPEFGDFAFVALAAISADAQGDIAQLPKELYHMVTMGDMAPDYRTLRKGAVARPIGVG